MRTLEGVSLVVFFSFFHFGTGQYGTDNVNVESTNPDDVGFFLYPNPSDINDSDELKFGDISSIQTSRFNATGSVILLSHGYTQNYTSQFPAYVRNAYLAAGFASKANIISVNWGKLSSTKDKASVPLVGDLLSMASYRQAMENVPVVGKRIADFLIFLLGNGLLVSRPNNKSRDVHLIGHSLGAHVSGMAGYYFQQSTSILLNRITGTDPAFPGYQQKSADEKLDPTDAYFVDVVHTDSAEYGEYITLGKVDFFVNGGGPNQPECSRVSDPRQSSCSHNLAPKYYAKSIFTDKIKACPQGIVPPPMNAMPCTDDKKITFGEYCPETARGSYALNLSL